MRLKYLYWSFPAALTPKQCDYIINLGETELENTLKSGGSIDAKTVTSGSGLERDTHISWLSQPELYSMIHPIVHEANVSAEWNFDWDFTGPAQYTKYGKDQFYGWHRDCLSQPYSEDTPDKNFAKKIRKLSVTVSLSEPSTYDGGNLQFDLGPEEGDGRYHTCEEIRPRGSVVVFPSHVPHKVTPVASGIRRSLVMWSLGPPFR